MKLMGKVTALPKEELIRGEANVDMFLKKKLINQKLKVMWENQMTPTISLSNLAFLGDKQFVVGKKILCDCQNKNIDNLELLLAYNRKRLLMYVKQ